MKVYRQKEREDIVWHILYMLQANMHLMITWTAKELLEPK